MNLLFADSRHLCLVFAVFTLAACGKTDTGTSPTAKEGAAPGAVESAAANALPNRAGKALVEAVDFLPDGVGMIVSVDVGGLTDQAFVELGKLLGVKGKDEETRRAMGDFLRQRLGLDIFRAGTVTVFEYEESFAAIVSGPAEALGSAKGKAENRGGVELRLTQSGVWTAIVKDRVVVGEKKAVIAFIDANTDGGKTLAGTEAGLRFLEMTDKLGPGDLVAALDSALLEVIPELLPGARVDGIGYAMDLEKGAVVLVKANAITRKLLVAKLKESRNVARDLIDHAKKEMEWMDLHQGLAVIYADRHLDRFFELFTPVEDGDYLTIRMEGQSSSMVAALSSMSVIAVPAFVKYMRKAKTAEAIDLLDKIYKGAADYYATPRVNAAKVERMACQFPAPQPPTPAAGTCCAAFGGPDADGNGRCDPNPDNWASATWSALRFQIPEEHHFVYSFDTNGKTGTDAVFTASAFADLDCDGIMSTFQRYGKGDPLAYRGECSVISAAALFTSNETE